MSNKITSFVEKFYPYALESEKLTKIPAVFTLAQSALETGWGKKSMGNNLFGITANKYWDGERVLVKTFEFHDSPNVKYPEVESVTYLPDKNKYKYIVHRYFRKYESYTECFNDHNEFLQKKRYRKAFDHVDDPKAFATEVAKAGYATSLHYASTLHKVIDRIQMVIDRLDLDKNDPNATYGKVIPARLNVRASFSLKAPVVLVINKEQQIRVWEKHEGWYKIRKGVRGWVSSKYIDEHGVVTAGSLNVRETAAGKLVDKVRKGTALVVLNEENGWSQVSSEQWVMGKFIEIIVDDEKEKATSANG